MFIQTLFSDPRLFFSQLLVVVFSLCVHEYCHALVAYKLGDPTPAQYGHLTLNPLKHMGLTSLIMLFFIGIAWGQIPVNTQNLKGKHAPALTALAGPGANVLLSLGFSVLIIVGALYELNPFARKMFVYGAVINMVLAIFNLLPVPGLDGWNILRTYWKKDLRTTPEFVKGIFIVLVMLLFAFFNYIYLAARIAVEFMIEAILVIGGWK